MSRSALCSENWEKGIIEKESGGGGEEEGGKGKRVEWSVEHIMANKTTCGHGQSADSGRDVERKKGKEKFERHRGRLVWFQDVRLSRNDGRYRQMNRSSLKTRVQVPVAVANFLLDSDQMFVRSIVETSFSCQLLSTSL